MSDNALRFSKVEMPESFDPTMKLDPGTHTDYWIQFLSYCNSTWTDNQSFVLFPRPILYFDKTAKKAWVSAIRNGLDRPLTDASSESLIRHYSQGSTLHSFLRVARKEGILGVLINSTTGNAAQRAVKLSSGRNEQGEWHAYAVFYVGGVLRIFDPARVYDTSAATQDGNQQLRICESLPLIRRWKSSTRNGLPPITRIEISGGEGAHQQLAGMSQTRTRDWILNRWVKEHMVLLANQADKSVGANDDDCVGNAEEPVWVNYVM